MHAELEMTKVLHAKRHVRCKVQLWDEGDSGGSEWWRGKERWWIGSGEAE
eukprot:EW704683.1.p5 GENE.EW704683.1~~EW704683.1.p5  ORF type:complete len:50 (-),score=6.59 EW704683.1:339-488(-)